MNRHVYEDGLGVSILVISTIIRLDYGKVIEKIKKKEDRNESIVYNVPFILKIKVLPRWSFFFDNQLEEKFILAGFWFVCISRVDRF